MRGVMRWLDQHLWAYALLLVVVDAGVLMAVRPSRSPIGAVLSAAFYAAFSLALYRRRRRRDLAAAGDEHADIRGLNRMINKGRIPEDPARRQQMRGLMARRKGQLRRLRWLAPAFTAMVLAVAVLPLVSGKWVAALPLLGLLVVLDGMVWFGYRRQRRTLRRLEQRLT
ncbi:hypothetical protein [Streptomyces sp. NPDC021224]|uniref:hypothetical protein n=1 Tax=unclassified Streptomyces TaxID=2593676 RepID=UPI0037BAC537